MSSLKLFRSTEFPQSRSFSPEAQRRSLHPVVLLAAACFWIAVPGNWLFWTLLARTPGLDGSMAWLALRLALLLGLASAGLLCLLLWRWTSRPAIAVALFATALASVQASTLPWFSWQALLILLLLALLPCAWLWRVRLRRISLRGNLKLVVATGLSCWLLFTLVLVFSLKDLAAVNARAPGVSATISPYAMAGVVRGLEKILLRRQP